MNSKKILMIAGEASGDLHGTHLVEAIHRIDPHVQFLGVGGAGLERAGMKILYPSRALSVVGITEVLPKIRSILKALRILKQSLDQEKPDLVVLIDFPDFNLRLAKQAYQRNIPVLYYISPQVWAWRSGRVKQIARWVKKMIVFFPFEVPIYENAGVDVHWVGHPLIDIAKPTLSREEALRQFGLDPKRIAIGLLPGSRPSEIERLLPTLLDAGRLLQKEIPTLQFIIPLASSISRAMVSSFLEKTSLPVTLIKDQTYDVMNISELLITASGTATLEGGILGTPMVILYKVSRLSYWIGRVLVHVDHIGLINLVAGERIVPELIQEEATPQRIAEEALRILKDPTLRQRMRESMTEVRQSLGEPGATERAARIVYSFMQER
ncbi:MAG: lipid-A-disaccharide synthase [Deltaproteobacteria bacterium RBG_16_48_10]|nr:MAG: lipid-A-disaccharide synthase [Deltaproteobacteria bacterium RBG_16_48_10]